MDRIEQLASLWVLGVKREKREERRTFKPEKDDRLKTINAGKGSPSPKLGFFDKVIFVSREGLGVGCCRDEEEQMEG